MQMLEVFLMSAERLTTTRDQPGSAIFYISCEGGRHGPLSFDFPRLIGKEQCTPCLHIATHGSVMKTRDPVLTSTRPAKSGVEKRASDSMADCGPR
jgi:hypothetical protein